ncbi:MAG: nucleotidyltransferase domain-containing protein [Armatimonadota bacterium]
MTTNPAVTGIEQTEVALLLHCARTRHTDEDVHRLRQLVQQGVDWRAFTQLARTHGIVPLCYHTLLQCCPDSVPADVMALLHEATGQRTRMGLLLLGELHKLLGLFAAHALPVIPLKGPILGQVLYGNPTLRESGDLDILVQERDMRQAKAVLLAQGYRPENPHEYTEVQIAAMREIYHHEVFIHPVTQMMVELHWRLAEYPFIGRLSDTSIWERSYATSLGGREMRLLLPADLLLFLCAHGAKHRWWYLKWLCDVAELLRTQPELDWPEVLTRARDTGNQRVLLLGVLLAHDVLDAPAPETLLQQARSNRVVVSLATQVRRGIGVADQSVPWQFDLFRFQMRTKERATDRLHLAVQRMLQPADGDWGALSLPPVLSFLYWVVRPFRLLTRYGRRCLVQLLKR